MRHEAEPGSTSAVRLVALALLAVGANCRGLAQSDSPLGWDPYFTVSGNFDGSFHKTQFFEDNHNAVVGQWDSRFEGWLPPFRANFSWGPYVRLTGIAA